MLVSLLHSLKQQETSSVAFWQQGDGVELPWAKVMFGGGKVDPFLGVPRICL